MTDFSTSSGTATSAPSGANGPFLCPTGKILSFDGKDQKFSCVDKVDGATSGKSATFASGTVSGAQVHGVVGTQQKDDNTALIVVAAVMVFAAYGVLTATKQLVAAIKRRLQSSEPA